jgi:hypothetical protein
MTKTRRYLCALSIVALIVIEPLPIAIGHSGMSLGPSTAFAKDGSSRDDSGHGGADDSGHGGNSGPGGGDASGSDNRTGGDEEPSSSRTTRKDQLNRKYLYGPHGERLEIRGSNIEIIYSDGFREVIRKGVLELTDPQGRRVVRRPVSGNDLSRIRELVQF